jgi:hypothetical protein
MLPYTSEVYFSLLELYNGAIWPAQWIASALALAAICITLKPSAGSGRIVSAILAVFWLWCGAVFHLLFFTSINFWAVGFAALFLLQALLFLFAGAVRGRLSISEAMTTSRMAGLVLMLFALAGYPLMSWLAGHAYPRMPLVGVAPAQTAIFTLGFLLSARRPRSIAFSAAPIIWVIIGAGSAWVLGIREDLSLIASLILFLALRTRA